MDIKVVTLRGESERQQKISAQLDALGLKFEFFYGVDGRLGPHPLFERCNPVKRMRIKGEPLLPGQLGCFASHFLLWQACVEAQAPLIVLEDDAIVDPERLLAFLEHVGSLDERFECLRLFKNNSKRYRSIKAGTLGDFEILKYTKGPMSTMGYYLTPYAAEKFLASAGEWVLPVDIFMDQFWKNRVECYGILPPVVSHDYGVESMIGYVPKHKKPKRSLKTKMNRELYALVQTLRKWGWNFCYRLRRRH
jgi:glycosyl transferase family 25